MPNEYNVMYKGTGLYKISDLMSFNNNLFLSILTAFLHPTRLDQACRNAKLQLHAKRICLIKGKDYISNKTFPVSYKLNSRNIYSRNCFQPIFFFQDLSNVKIPFCRKPFVESPTFSTEKILFFLISFLAIFRAILH